jgi:hypothetical protein
VAALIRARITRTRRFMDIIFIAVGMFVSYIFLSRRELLIEKKSFRFILGVSILLFVLGVTLHFTAVGRFYASEVLLCPLPSLLLFRLLRKLFIKLFKHEPQDTFLNWKDGLGEDRVFNIVYGVLSFLLMMLAFNITKALTKAGW